MQIYPISRAFDVCYLSLPVKISWSSNNWVIDPDNCVPEFSKESGSLPLIVFKDSLFTTNKINSYLFSDAVRNFLSYNKIDLTNPTLFQIEKSDSQCILLIKMVEGVQYVIPRFNLTSEDSVFISITLSKKKEPILKFSANF